MEILEAIDQIAKRVLDRTHGPSVYTDGTSYDIPYNNPPMEIRRDIYNALLANFTASTKKVSNVFKYMILISDSKEEYEHALYFVKELLRLPGVIEIAMSSDMWVLLADKICKYDVDINTFNEKFKQEQETNQEA